MGQRESADHRHRFGHGQLRVGRAFGEAYDWDRCKGHCDQEEVAIAAATWQLMPQSFNGTFFTDWHKSRIVIFYRPNLKASGGYSETTINAP